jgi:hypothetical protein
MRLSQARPSLTGRALFTGHTLDELLQSIVVRDLPPLSDLEPGLPQAVDAVLRRVPPEPAGAGSEREGQSTGGGPLMVLVDL